MKQCHPKQIDRLSGIEVKLNRVLSRVALVLKEVRKKQSCEGQFHFTIIGPVPKEK